ncbi:MAG TPA: carbohydrate porin [Gammaproteobacteria bacterium]|nr:carbohydrate porin [Gammaproteobacteria bacterium]
MSAGAPATRPANKAHGKCRWFLAALVALGTATPAWTSAETLPAAEALTSRNTLTGDWDGRRAAWAERGVVIGIDHFGDLMAVVDGGEERGMYYSGLLEVGVEFDLATLLGWPDTRAVVLGVGTFGRDPGDGAGSMHAPSNLANVPTGTLLEAWLEREFFDGRLALLGGLYAVDSEFDVKESAGVFMNGGFGTGLELSETGLNGPCVYSATCLGVRARYQPDDARYVQFAVLDGGAGDPDQPRGLQIDLDGDDGLFVIGETGFQRSTEAGRFLRAALGAWHYTTEFDNIVQPGPPTPLRTSDGTYGVYALLEGSLYGEPGQAVQGMSGFVRIGFADQKVNPIGRYAGAGLVYTGLLPARDEDVLGLGVSVAFLGQDFRDTQALAGTPVQSRELVFELAYWMPVLPWFNLQLDAQYISNPAADPALANATLFGLRYQVTF